MTRAAIYIRQSQYHDGSISEALQEEQCRALCAREGYEVVDVFRDIDLSGTSTVRRKGLAALRKAYDAGAFDVAVAHAASRFARNMADGAELVGAMPLHTVLEGRADQDDDFVPLLHMLLAHKQSKEIGRRWREVHEHRTSRGLSATGRARLGYDYDPVRGLVVREEHRTEVVRLFTDYTAGTGFHTLVQRLNGLGITNTRGGVWEITALRKTMDSGVHAGYITVRGELVPGAHEAILTEAQWAAYRGARAERARRAARAQTASWYLAGLLRCGVCGGSATRSQTKGYWYVECVNRRNRGPQVCSGVRAPVHVIERAVAMWLGTHVDEWAAASPSDDEARTRAESDLAAAKARQADADAVLGRLATGWASGLLDDAGYTAARVQADANKAAAAADVAEAEALLSRLLPADADVYAAIERGGAGLDTATWNGVLRRLIDHVRVDADKSAHVVAVVR